MKFITFNFNFRLFLYLVLGFVLCTIVGTVSHEAGHCAVAKYYGRNPELHYAYMIPGAPAWIDEYHKEFAKNKNKLLSREPSPEKEEFKKFAKRHTEKFKRESFYITLGGPAQTMFTGIIGFTILWYRRKKIYSRKYLNPMEWIAVFLTYFWSREVFNFLFSINATFSAQTHFSSDEPKLSQYLQLPPWAFGLITCIIGGIILLWVTFRAIPIHQRLTFLLSGLIGSAMGWMVWLEWLGPVLLP